MEKALIILAIALFASVIIKNTDVFKKDTKRSDSPVDHSNSTIPPVKHNRDITPRFKEWTVYVLDNDGKVIDKKEMSATSDNPFSIGYDKDCDLVIKSDYISRVHLKIGKDEEGYFVKDSSLNGTFVDDKEYRNESFSLKEGLVYVADVPVYFKKNSFFRPKVVPKLEKNSVEDVNATKRFDGFNKTKNWNNKKEEYTVHSPISR